MKKVSVAVLKENLSKYLHEVKNGEELVVTSHQQPVARVISYEKGDVPVTMPSRPIKEWGKWSGAYASRIWQVEALRATDRIRMEGRIDDSQVASLREQIELINETLILVPVSEAVLTRSAESFPTVIGTLEAIHLSSALLLKPTVTFDSFLTHDKQLATAAQSVGFHVDGVD